MSEEMIKKVFIDEEGDESKGLQLFARWQELEKKCSEGGNWLESRAEHEELNGLRSIIEHAGEEAEKPKRGRGRPKGTPKTQAQKDRERNETRGRNFTLVLYPEDLPDNWEEIVKSVKAKSLYILHDKDENADGEPKKPHVHWLIMFDGYKSLAQVRGLMVSLFGENEDGAIPGVATVNKHCLVHDRGAMVRYLVHMDNPEKYQYAVDDIKALGGADIMELLRRSMSETQNIMIAMEEYIEEHDITESCDFSRAIRYTHPDWYMILTTKSTVYFNAFIRSRRHKLRESYEDESEKFEKQKAFEALGMQVDEETGEVTEVTNE